MHMPGTACDVMCPDLGCKDTVVWPEVKQNKTKQDTPLPPPPTAASHLPYPTSKTQIGRIFTSETVSVVFEAHTCWFLLPAGKLTITAFPWGWGNIFEAKGLDVGVEGKERGRGERRQSVGSCPPAAGTAGRIHAPCHLHPPGHLPVTAQDQERLRGLWWVPLAPTMEMWVSCHRGKSPANSSIRWQFSTDTGKVHDDNEEIMKGPQGVHSNLAKGHESLIIRE